MASTIYSNSHLVEVYGLLAGRIVADSAGWHVAHDLDWSTLGRYSTRRRAAHALELNLLRALYPPTVEMLLDELQRGLICLNQDPANLNRLERCEEVDIRAICARLLERRWPQTQVATLVAKWRELKGGV